MNTHLTNPKEGGSDWLRAIWCAYVQRVITLGQAATPGTLHKLSETHKADIAAVASVC